MTILAVDPNPNDLNVLTRCLTSVHPNADIKTYTDPMLAFQYAFHHRIDAVFTVVLMQRLDGFALTKMLRGVYKDLPVYLIEKNNSHRTDAMRLGVRGYLVKPVTEQAIFEEETAEDW